MKSYKSFTGARGGLAAATTLPTLEECDDDHHRYEELDYSSSEGSLEGQQQQQGHHPSELLGVSWGSYLYGSSSPPTRAGEEMEASSRKIDFDQAQMKEIERTVESVVNQPEPAANQLEAARETTDQELTKQRASPEGMVMVKTNEPHPLLLQHLEGLMSALARGKDELIGMGMDVIPLTLLSNATSHADMKELIRTATVELGRASSGDEVNLTADLLHSIIEYLREVLHGLVDQGKKLSLQAGFLQRTAKQLNRNQEKSLKQQRIVEENLEKIRTHMRLEKEELEKERRAIYEAKVELKAMLQEIEEKLSQAKIKKGRMDSPHTIAQNRGQLNALLKTQKQQALLEKMLTKQQRDIRHLQEAHDFTKSELLAVQDHAKKLQQKLTMQIHEIKCSEASLSSQLLVRQNSLQHHPSIALDKEKRRSYHNTSRTQVQATLKGIATAQKTLCVEIERMQRQFAKQHSREQQLSRQLDRSHQQLLETESRLKGHSTNIKRQRSLLSTHKELKSEDIRLPDILSNSHSPKKEKKSGSIPLPRIPSSDHYMTAVRNNMQQSRSYAAESKPSRGHLPASRSHPTGSRSHPAGSCSSSEYKFSKRELCTLAKFDDRETAEQVMEWLQLQGKLRTEL